MPLNIKYRLSAYLPQIQTKPKTPKESNQRPKSTKTKRARLPTPDALRTRNGLIPRSLESMRRKAMMLIHGVEKDLQCFKDKYFRNPKNTFGFQTDDLIRFVHEKNGKQARAKDHHEFQRYLDNCRTTASLLHKEEIKKVDFIIERTTAFDRFVERAKDLLKEAFEDHVDRYCLSFASEAENYEIKCVQDYENNIVEWRQKIKANLKDLVEILSHISDNLYGESFEEFKRHYDDILYSMKSALKLFPKVTNILKDWMTADEAYPRKVHDHINSLMAEKIQNIAEGRKRELRTGHAQHSMKRSDFNTKYIHKKLQEATSTKRFFRKKEIALSERRHKLDEKIGTKQKEEERLYETFYLQYDSQRGNDKTMEQIKSVQEEQNKLNKALANTIKHLEKTVIQRKALNKDIHQLQKRHERSVKTEKGTSNQAEKEEGRLKNNHQVNTDLKKKIECLNRIHTLKTHPDTLRSITCEGYTPGRKMDIIDSFGNACKITAANIGHAWSELYMELPFEPKRDDCIKGSDIEAFDIAGQKRDLRTRDVALQSLGKWKRLSSAASVHALMFALRCVGKGQIARKIEKHGSSSS